jgi:tetratricopeptide (TPR) repeat protein/transcriptional regulator with XRE-family HTH domain
VFGQLVRENRRRMGLSQEDLAAKTGISVRSIGKIEAGRIASPRPVTVRLLADAFGLRGDGRDRFCAAAADATARSLGREAVPKQLPPDVWGFTGRTAELDRLDELLAVSTPKPSTVVITAVSGTAGVGKTALAVHWAHRVADRFPDGQLYVNLRGFDISGQAVDPAAAVRGFLDALQVPAQRIPTAPDAQAALYRSLLAGRRMLIVLDNARDTAQVRPLLPGAAGCRVVVTSRNQLTSLVAAHGAQSLTVDLLNPDEARHLLAHRLGTDRVAAEPDAVEKIIARCARLPLALTLVAARATIRPDTALGTLAGELDDADQRWRTLTGDEPSSDVRAVFSWSYAALTPDAARLFRLTGLHPGPDLTAPAAASLTALPLEEARPLLAELNRANLIVEHAPGRYGLHDLLHAYAADLAYTTDPDSQRHAATHRVLDHYLHSADIADRLLYPVRDRFTLTPVQPGVTPERLSDRQQALDWFTAEHPVLLAVVDHAAATSFDTHAWQLGWTVAVFLDWQGLWHDEAATCQVALAAAQRLADPAAEARAHRTLAHADTELGRFNDADTHLSRALDLYRRIGDQTEQAHTHFRLSALRERQENLPQALDHLLQALDLYRAVGHHVGQAVALSDIGWTYALLGDHQQALTSCQRALPLHREVGNQDGEAGTWSSLGYAHHHLGHYTEAEVCHKRALDLYRDLGNRRMEATVLAHLGDTHRAAGSPAAARHAYRQALAILTDLDHPDAGTVRGKLDAVESSRPAPGGAGRSRDG